MYMKRKYREYTDDEFRDAAASVKSLAGLLRVLNLKPAGGNYVHAKYTLQRLQVNTDHWTGQAWNRGEQLKDFHEYTRANRIKPHLIKERGHCCEKCTNTHWLGVPITLEVHHLDGDRSNNEKNNLQLLCCNCHSVTESWRRPKKILTQSKLSN